MFCLYLCNYFIHQCPMCMFLSIQQNKHQKVYSISIQDKNVIEDNHSTPSSLDKLNHRFLCWSILWVGQLFFLKATQKITKLMCVCPQILLLLTRALLISMNPWEWLGHFSVFKLNTTMTTVNRPSHWSIRREDEYQEINMRHRRTYQTSSQCTAATVSCETPPPHPFHERSQGWAGL